MNKEKIDKEPENVETAHDKGVVSTGLLGCLRWHENEIIELGKLIEECEGDEAPLIVSMNNNLKAKIRQHESFVTALKAV